VPRAPISAKSGVGDGIRALDVHLETQPRALRDDDLFPADDIRSQEEAVSSAEETIVSSVAILISEEEPISSEEGMITSSEAILISEEETISSAEATITSSEAILVPEEATLSSAEATVTS
jgi:hypothetical protein